MGQRRDEAEISIEVDSALHRIRTPFPTLTNPRGSSYGLGIPEPADAMWEAAANLAAARAAYEIVMIQSARALRAQHPHLGVRAMAARLPQGIGKSLLAHHLAASDNLLFLVTERASRMIVDSWRNAGS